MKEVLIMSLRRKIRDYEFRQLSIGKVKNLYEERFGVFRTETMLKVDTCVRTEEGA